MIKAVSLNKSYAKNIPALTDVSFEIQEGEIVYVLGESGSGKSTLLKIIAGLEDANEGTVTVGEEEITGPSKNLVPGYDFISYVPQDFKLQKFWTVRDNIGKKISFYPADEKKSRVDELLKIFKLEDKAEDFPLELSGGQQQRIAMAAALSDQPEVMLLDEPFSNLDLPLKAQIRLEIIEMLRETGVTVMLVSHDPTDALAFSDQILILQDGRLIQKADPKTLYHLPTSKYAGQFLGPINKIVLDGEDKLIRPENLILSEKGHFEGKVMKCFFAGSHYQLYLKINGQLELTLLYAAKQIKINSVVRFEIN